jgi:hypothetical protein
MILWLEPIILLLLIFDLILKLLPYLLVLDWIHEQLVCVAATQLIDVHCQVVLKDWWLQVGVTDTDHYENGFLSFLQELTQNNTETGAISQHETLTFVQDNQVLVFNKVF